MPVQPARDERVHLLHQEVGVDREVRLERCRDRGNDALPLHAQDSPRFHRRQHAERAPARAGGRTRLGRTQPRRNRAPGRRRGPGTGPCRRASRAWPRARPAEARRPRRTSSQRQTIVSGTRERRARRAGRTRARAARRSRRPRARRRRRRSAPAASARAGRGEAGDRPSARAWSTPATPHGSPAAKTPRRSSRCASPATTAPPPVSQPRRRAQLQVRHEAVAAGQHVAVPGPARARRSGRRPRAGPARSPRAPTRPAR